MLTLNKRQEKELRQALKNLINKRNMLSTVDKYYGYQIKSEGAQGERIYFKKLNLYTNKFYFEPNLTTTQAKDYFNIK